MPPKELKEIARLKAELTVARRAATKAENRREEAEKLAAKHERKAAKLAAGLRAERMSQVA